MPHATAHSLNVALGLMRERVHRTPSALHWAALTRLMLAFDPDDQLALDYVAQHTHAWDDATRINGRWAERLDPAVLWACRHGAGRAERRHTLTRDLHTGRDTDGAWITLRGGWGAHCPRLSVYQPPEPDNMRRLLEVLDAAPPRGLTLNAYALNDDQASRGVAQLARWPALAHVRHLGLSGHMLNDDASDALIEAAASGRLASLRSLDILAWDLSAERFDALVATGALDRLERLHLSTERLGASDGRALARVLGNGALRELSLYSNDPNTWGLSADDDLDAFEDDLSDLHSRSSRSTRTRTRADGDLLGAALNHNPTLTLSKLSLFGRAIASPAALTALAAAPGSDGLRALELSEQHATDARLKAALNHPSRASLHTLAVTYPRVALSLKALDDLPPQLRLRELELKGWPNIAPDALARVAQAPATSALEDLDLSSSKPHKDAARLFASAPWRATLRALDLTGAERLRLSLPELVGASRWPALESLWVGNLALPASVTDATLARLDAPRLHTLSLGGNYLEDSSADLLVRHTSNAPLTELNLYDVGLSAAGLRRLTQAPWWPRLRWLNLTHNPMLDHDALTALAQAPPATELVQLDLPPLPDLNPSHDKSQRLSDYVRSLGLSNVTVSDQPDPAHERADRLRALVALLDSPALNPWLRLQLLDIAPDDLRHDAVARAHLPDSLDASIGLHDAAWIDALPHMPPAALDALDAWLRAQTRAHLIASLNTSAPSP